MNKEEIQKLKDILWANTWDDEQIIREGIATLQNSFNLEDEGFRRIESAGLLAIYTLQHQLEEKDKVINEIEKRCNQEISAANVQYERHKRNDSWQYIIAHKRILEILERGKNGK